MIHNTLPNDSSKHHRQNAKWTERDISSKYMVIPYSLRNDNNNTDLELPYTQMCFIATTIYKELVIQPIITTGNHAGHGGSGPLGSLGDRN